MQVPAGSNGTAIGYQSMMYLDLGATPYTNYNVAVGYQSLMGGQSLPIVNTGNFNTAVGYQALTYNTSGSSNTSMGTMTLYSNTSGDRNTGIGDSTLFSNTIGYENMGIAIKHSFTIQQASKIQLPDIVHYISTQLASIILLTVGNPWQIIQQEMATAPSVYNHFLLIQQERVMYQLV
jgi:hypothetical protein